MPELPTPEPQKTVTETTLTRHELRERQKTARRVYLDQSSPQVRSIARVVVITLVLLFLAGWVQAIITSLSTLAFLLVLSIFFAYLIDPLVRAIRRPFKARGIDKWMPRSLAIPFAYFLVFSILGAAIALIAPGISEQAQEFGKNLPTYAQTIRERSNDLTRSYNRLRIPEPVQDEIERKATEIASEVTSEIGNFLLAAVAYVPWLILVPILAFFFLKDVNQFRLAILRMFPVGRWRYRAELVISDLNSTLAALVRAQLISCLVIALLCTLGFSLIGLKYALLLGMIAGVFEFVPLLGPLTIGVVVTLIAAGSEHPRNAAYVAIFLIVLRIVQDYVLYPRIVRGGIHLHPLAIILSVLAGEQVAGIPGVFLAIPLVAVGTVLYRHILEHRGTPRGLVSNFIAEAESHPEEAV